jgi:BTB/POZ domain
MCPSNEKSTLLGYDNTTLGVSDDEDEDEYLSWRLDPVASMSDWTIQIVRDDQEDDVYYVHKIMIAIGPRKSGYFAGVIKNSQLQEGLTRISRIPLEKAAAGAIPTLLDFMYSDEVDITTNHAGALRALADYFRMILFFRKVTKFIQGDLNMTNVHVYIQNAVIFHDGYMVALARDLIAKNIHVLKSSSPLLETIVPDLFLQIVISPEIDTCGMSCHLSILVATYCQLHQQEISSEVFDKLTDQKHLPLIDKHAALIFLELQTGLVVNQSTDVSCLQKRCIPVVMDSWKVPLAKCPL